MIRVSFYSLFIAFALLASGIYLLKYDVQGLREENIRLQKQIADERLALELLEAEWAYLNRPDRVQKLADKYLNIAPVVPVSMVSFVDIPRRSHAVAQLGE